MITECEKCKGHGWKCRRCGMNRGRHEAKTCRCGSRTRVRCEGHTPTICTCDVCGIRRPPEQTVWPEHEERARYRQTADGVVWVVYEHPTLKKRAHLCGACDKARRELEAITVWDLLCERRADSMKGREWRSALNSAGEIVVTIGTVEAK